MHYAPQGHATFGDPHPLVKRHSDNIYGFNANRRPDGENQAQVLDWGPEIRGDMLCH